jgi:antitoxin YefM
MLRGVQPTLALINNKHFHRIAVTYDKAYHCLWFLEKNMNTLTASEARSNLYRLIDEAALSHEPVVITGKRNSAVLVSQEDWASIQETLYLLSIQGMRESIKDGMALSVDECSKELDW